MPTKPKGRTATDRRQAAAAAISSEIMQFELAKTARSLIEVVKGFEDEGTFAEGMAAGMLMLISHFTGKQLQEFPHSYDDLDLKTIYDTAGGYGPDGTYTD